MSIHQNLKALRLARGMTQEQAAARLNVTRQTISSYEAGRTRPDVETLIRLAELYGVELEQILYGPEAARLGERRLRLAAWGLSALLILLNLARCGVMLASNLLFPVTPGVQRGEALVIVQSHMRLTALWEGLDGALLLAASLGFLLLLCGGLALRVRLSLLQWARGWGLLAAGLVLPGLLLAWRDPVFAPVDYLISPVCVLADALVFSAVFLAFQAILHRRAPSR